MSDLNDAFKWYVAAEGAAAALAKIELGAQLSQSDDDALSKAHLFLILAVDGCKHVSTMGITSSASVESLRAFNIAVNIIPAMTSLMDRLKGTRIKTLLPEIESDMRVVSSGRMGQLGLPKDRVTALREFFSALAKVSSDNMSNIMPG